MTVSRTLRGHQWVIRSRRTGQVGAPLDDDPTRHLPPQFEVLRRDLLLTTTEVDADGEVTSVNHTDGPWTPRQWWVTPGSLLTGIGEDATRMLAALGVAAPDDPRSGGT